MSTTINAADKAALDRADPNSIADILHRLGFGTLLESLEADRDALIAGDTAGVALVAGTIAAVDVKALNATPIEVIPAPAAGKYIEIVSVHWFLDFAAVAYDAAAAGDALVLKYTDDAGAECSEQVPGNTIGAAAADYHAIVKAKAGAVIPVINAAVVAHILVGEWWAAAGDSPLKYEILYRERTFAL